MKGRRLGLVALVTLSAVVVVWVIATKSGNDSDGNGRSTTTRSTSPSTQTGPDSTQDPGSVATEEILAGVAEPEPAARAAGTIQTDDGAQPADAEVLAVQANRDSTLLIWRLRTGGAVLGLRPQTVGEDVRSRNGIGTGGIVLLTDKMLLQPFVGSDVGCVCSMQPVKIDRVGQVLTGLYPPIPADVKRLDVRIPGFPVLDDVVVSR